MKNLLIAGVCIGLMGAISVEAQTIDLGIEQTPQKETAAKPNINDLPEIKNLRPENDTEVKKEEQADEAKEETAEEKKEEGGFFSFLNFFKKDDTQQPDVIENKETFLEALTRKAEEGNIDAQVSLGYMYLYGDSQNNIGQDYKKSFKYYSMAAAQGDSIAINNLGSLYYSGIGTKKNMTKAAELFAQAADKGNEESALNLAFLYLSGNGIPRDNRKAMDYFVQAGQQGNLTAKFMLGYAYYRGFIVPQDYKRAFALMKDAAKAGYDDAQLFMGLMYLTGDGTIKNYGNAVRYLGNAVDQGNINAAVHLANIYAEGKVYTKNPVQAYMLYSIAANSGIEEAAAKRDELEKTLQIETLLQAQAATEKFSPNPKEITTYIRRTFGSNIFSYIADQMPTQYIETPQGGATANNQAN